MRSTGVTAICAVQDYTATGDITYFWADAEEVGQVTAYGKGLTEFRMDAAVAGGTQNLVLNETGGILTDINRQVHVIPFANVMNGGSLTLPALRMANALSDSTISVTYLGLAARQGQQTVQVRITPPPNPSFATIPQFQVLGTFDLFFDPTSKQLLEMTETILSTFNINQSFSHEVLFSNYSSINGVSIPLKVSEKMGGQETWSVVFSSVKLNSGLTDAFFAY